MRAGVPWLALPGPSVVKALDAASDRDLPGRSRDARAQRTRAHDGRRRILRRQAM